MDMPENEDNNELTVDDFAFICRICCERKSGLRVFQDERYLYDLFNIIRQIDVRSGVQFPKNICNGCINELEDLSSFIQIIMIEDERFWMIKPKKQFIECTKEIESGVLPEYLPTIEDDMNTSLQKTGVCKICFSSRSSATASKENIHRKQQLQNNINTEVFSGEEYPKVPDGCISLPKDISSLSAIGIEDRNSTNSLAVIQTCTMSSPPASSPTPSEEFQNIDNTDEEVEINNPEINEICKECDKILEKVSSFVCSSLCNDQKLENAALRKNTVEPLYCYSPISDADSSTYQELPIESVIRGNTPVPENTFEESELLYENMVEVADTNEEINSELASSAEGNYQEGLTFHSPTFPEENRSERTLAEETLVEDFHPPLQSSTIELVAITKSNGRFECNYCNKSFKLFHQFKKHFVIHNENQFNCDECGKSFNRKCNLKRHMLLHIEDKPFQCDRCGKRFNRQSNLKLHMLRFGRGKSSRCEPLFWNSINRLE